MPVVAQRARFDRRTLDARRQIAMEVTAEKTYTNASRWGFEPGAVAYTRPTQTGSTEEAA
jgi:hypothetical protein